MSEAVSKVEVWEPGAGSALYTLTNECLSVYFKEILTSGIGNFQIGLPTKKEATYYYMDIELFDKVKIWLGSTSGNPNFIGKISEISGPLSTEQGYLRILSGLSQGEILLRRFKENKFYNAVQAATIVTEWANDLSLGAGDIAADTTAVTLEVQTKTYFDLLRAISDYWYSAGSQIKKDFYVDTDYDLVWKARPLRTVGVPTLTVGDNILGYNVMRKIEEVKNRITTYGKAEKPLPSDKDLWTESLTNWTASAGTLSLQTGGGIPRVGASCIKCNAGVGAYTSTFKRDIPRTTLRDIKTLYFWISYTNPSTRQVRLHAPDSSNYFYLDTGDFAGWAFKTYQLGPDQEYYSDTNPNGIWLKTGSPNWWDLEFIEFHTIHGVGNVDTYVDGIYFYPDRWSNIASDATSQTNYGRRDLELTDDKLHSDGEYQKRGETLLYQHKDPPIQIIVTAKGDNNILVGDRIPLTIPAENITAQNYDVISVDQTLTLERGFFSIPTMMNTANIREAINAPAVNALFKLKQLARELALTERKYG